MTQAFIVSASALTKAGRWDVGFHHLAQKHHQAASALEDSLSKEEAREIASEVFENLPTPFRQSIAPLTRTNQRGNAGKDSLITAINEYPFLSLAVFQSLESDIETHFDAELADIENRRARLTAQSNRALRVIKPKDR